MDTIRLIRSDRLLAELASPGIVYSRPRFDWGGAVVQVTLDGEHRFCSADRRPHPLSCGGIGLMNEFIPSDQGTFDNPDYGGSFIKIGVGILGNGTGLPYIQKTNYPLECPLSYSEEWSSSSYSVRGVQSEFFGYAYELGKTVRAVGAELILEMELKNTGKKTLEFQEYNHNFLRLSPGGAAAAGAAADVGLAGAVPVTGAAGHCVAVRWKPELGNPADFDIVADSADGLHWVVLKDFAGEAVFTEFRGYPCGEKGYFRLIYPPAGLSVSETLDRPLSKMALWATKDVVCPELFASFRVAAGESVRWERRYGFGAGAV
jgi:hypothetical protein